MPRLDSLLVDLGFARSRERAKAAVRAGLVRVDGAVATKPSATVRDGAAVACAGEDHPWVSRGALKLVEGLDAFGVSAKDRICLDLGASTGGFTEVLLSRGARRVYAVDVGHDQLAPSLASDPRVANLERTHAKALGVGLVPDPIGLLVCDVSFISLTKALPPALALCSPGAEAVVLVKPQFELGPDALGKGGLVRAADDALRDWARAAIVPWFEERGWDVIGLQDSPIRGGDGNLEFLLAARHG
ncbi:TlyA family RNA methyltransferase [Parvularcula dongshanensis]|uniref:23S rRNA (Cytidine1920-2'-O)/16S rRNA (Cytidine1409-2'-O)-methyltransferase n=1 Tax=Parvularcula dongshanensis TaxID=1173995 RepID=A0A840I2U6_9PROT|nr:TlyA family RNA methyltransferase [Parvularcula dongshanensis]MBB4658655.1 23S rRNA (cytidine1920-2'-O)/16S rRNA (cytidine1409-2'-O)-methyltransferase [Parvularcula dongshanensis]